MTRPAQSSTDRVRVETEVALDPATAFEVFTAEIGDWWWRGKDLGTGRSPRAGRLRFEPGIGGRLLEVYEAGGDDAFVVGRIQVWEPADRLVFEWRQGNYEPDQSTEVEVRFERSERGTRVTLEHRGLDALPDDAGARHGLGRSAAYVDLVRNWLQGQLDDYRARADARAF